VGAITETVTVTGESPVVDTQRIQQVKVMTRDVIDAVPTGKTFQNVGVLVAGVPVGAGGTGAVYFLKKGAGEAGRAGRAGESVSVNRLPCPPSPPCLPTQ